MKYHVIANILSQTLLVETLFCVSSTVYNRRHEAAANQQTQQPARRGPAHHRGGAVEGLEDLRRYTQVTKTKATYVYLKKKTSLK